MGEPVECLSSASYPGDPVAFTWQGERREVEAILGRWRTPRGLSFRVRTKSLDSPGELYELIYDAGADGWRVIPL